MEGAPETAPSIRAPRSIIARHRSLVRRIGQKLGAARKFAVYEVQPACALLTGLVNHWCIGMLQPCVYLHAATCQYAA